MHRATQAGQHTGVEGGASAGDTALAHRTLLHDWVMGHVAGAFSARAATPRYVMASVSAPPSRPGRVAIERKEVAARQR